MCVSMSLCVCVDVRVCACAFVRVCMCACVCVLCTLVHVRACVCVCVTAAEGNTKEAERLSRDWREDRWDLQNRTALVSMHLEREARKSALLRCATGKRCALLSLLISFYFFLSLSVSLPLFLCLPVTSPQEQI